MCKAMACGGFIPRAGFASFVDSDDKADTCSAAVAAAHSACSGQRACQSLMEALSADASEHHGSRTARRAAKHLREHIMSRQAGSYIICVSAHLQLNAIIFES